MPARERESIRFVLIPFTPLRSLSPPRLSFPQPPGKSRAAQPVIVSFHSSRSRLSPRPPPRGATSAPTRIFKKAVSYPSSLPSSPPPLHHLRFQLWPEPPRRHLTPPFRRHRPSSSSFFSASSPIPFLLVSHLRVSFNPSGRAATTFQITPPLSLFSLFALSRRLPFFSPIFFFCYSSLRKAYASILSPPPADYVIFCFSYSSTIRFMYIHLRRMRVRRDGRAFLKS